MGLDWIPIPKARPGFEAAHAKLTRERKAILEDEDDLDAVYALEISDSYYKTRVLMLEELKALLSEVSISPFEEVGCPRVGMDPEATEWFRTEFYEKNRPTNPRNHLYGLPFEEVLEKYHGRYVEELAKIRPDDGGPPWSPSGFRGKLIGRLQPWIGDELVGEAYLDHDAGEAVEYADRLDWRFQIWRQVPLRKEGHEEAERTLFQATRWLRFWGGRGFGFYAWY